MTSAPPSPNQVASRSGAIEKPVRLSTLSRTIRDSGYLVRPAARSSRRYGTSAAGKPSAGTTSRSTRCCSGSRFTASTVARLISRKSPASAGTCRPTSRRINR